MLKSPSLYQEGEKKTTQKNSTYLRNREFRAKKLIQVSFSILLLTCYPKPKPCLDSSLIEHQSLNFFVQSIPHKFFVCVCVCVCKRY